LNDREKNLKLGNEYFENKSYTEAERYYKKALEWDPNYTSAWVNLGITYFYLENYTEAIQCYIKALELNSNDAYAWFSLGNTYNALKNNTEAERSYNKALELDPYYNKAWCNLGNVYENLKNYTKAEQCYKRALELDPNYIDARNYLGNVLKVKKEKISSNIKKIMKVSTKIRLDIMRDVLKMEFSEFNEKLLDWAVEFGFKIDGDYIIIENSDVEGFINQLDKQFELWENREK
jgi:tetratricopeptide (TPR) repeat protein